MKLDLNCDLGEEVGQDAALMPFISSANIACGAHAGSLETMVATARLAKEWGVAIGAHPGFADRDHFGRRELTLSPEEIFTLVKSQVEALQAVAEVRHVKPHGALYNQSAREPRVARAVAEAVKACSPHLRLFGLSGSVSLVEGKRAGLTVVAEVFSDRTYQADGSLTPRTQPGALISTQAAMIEQVLEMVLRRRVRSLAGSWVSLSAETLCLHGDGENAASFARALNHELKAAGIEVAPW
ncbi:MAG TPA: 5-oxoprolinase subunit PxpA [Opitutaceae bacterium]|nr:5-oxoprolinase subunit PxpA [Opitutaceae bacterium]